MLIAPSTFAEQLRSAAVPPLVLHVLPPESWESRRLPGSHCACVYEMTFLETVRGLAPELDTPIVVYGAGLPSLESAVAAEKLTAAGYTTVFDFSGGLEAWEAEGLPVEGSGNPPAHPAFDGIWHADTATSVIRWTGRNLFNHHEGTVRLGGGSFEISGGNLTGGGFEIDLRGITCTDLADPGYNAMLLRHLADRDFFETAAFPTARFALCTACLITDATPGTPNYQIEGTLTLRGVSRPLAFPALIALNDEGQLTGQAWLEIDRTQWGVNYGSGRLFSWLGKHVVNDHIGLHLKIHATRG